MVKKVDIVQIITRLNIGGAATHVVILAREMDRFGFCTILTTGTCERDEGDMSYLLNEGDSVRWIPELSRSIHPLRNVVALWRLWRLLRRERPMIVHTHTAMAGCLGRVAAKLAGVPITIHTFHGNSLQEYFSPLTNRLCTTIERLLAKFTDVICVVAEQQVRELSDGFRLAPRHKFRVIPLGLDLDPYLRLQQVEVSPKPLRVLWLGRLVPIKGISLLRDVIEKSVGENLAVHFVIAGDGLEAHTIRSLALKYPNHVTWLGWQKDTAPVVASGHLLIQTSKNEGTPVALIQGMAAGRPFISTAVGGIVDMVEGMKCEMAGGCDGYSNAVLTPQDPEAFVAAFKEFIGKPHLLSEMGDKARAFAERRYRKEMLADNINALYQSLIDRNSNGARADCAIA
jgi:glycosyltransferase involved in cell wall biosynthesis